MHPLRWIAPVLVAFIAAVSSAGHTDAPMDLGPAVGSALPQPFDVRDSEGAVRSFDSLQGENGTVLVFFRSAKWCPFCQLQLMTLNQISEDLKGLGYPVVGISYDDPSVLADFKDRRMLEFTLVSDADSSVIDAFGIRNPDYPEGHMAHGVPYPLIAVFGKDGTLKAKLYEAAYRDRPANEVILETVQGLAG